MTPGKTRREARRGPGRTLLGRDNSGPSGGRSGRVRWGNPREGRAGRGLCGSVGGRGSPFCWFASRVSLASVRSAGCIFPSSFNRHTLPTHTHTHHLFPSAIAELNADARPVNYSACCVSLPPSLPLSSLLPPLCSSPLSPLPGTLRRRDR